MVCKTIDKAESKKEKEARAEKAAKRDEEEL